MEHPSMAVGSILGGTGSAVLCWVVGMVDSTQFVEVVLWAVVGAAVGWFTQLILNKYFKKPIDKFLNNLNKKVNNGNPS